ncbi:hypothetical protein [Burkholderia cenocepacia]|uniref:hypothetical protein n=1 Tax=Burkholderia cenocepacia TaxID=95486 RepID=UPI001BA1158A|nr:hypothetical protein [Burkholderia cenocepacia]MBR8096993.1 hypothetical protein [Burkholderia cenocepacia]MDI9686864.1 hypothetical protein [Burkholderia cenocepacia]HEP6426676.1 hypothetical protein [Burkholderia cenocepacia]
MSVVRTFVYEKARKGLFYCSLQILEAWDMLSALGQEAPFEWVYTESSRRCSSLEAVDQAPSMQIEASKNATLAMGAFGATTITDKAK